MQIKEAILEYLHHLIVNQVKAKATVERYQTVLNNYQDYLKETAIIEINQIDTTDIQTYLGLLKEQYQPKTVSQSISIIRSFHNYLANHFSNLNNPALKIKTTKTPSKLPKFFSEDDLEHFFASFSDQENDVFHRAIFELLYATGLRVTELVSLTFQELNTNNQMIKIVGKGNKERIIPIATYSLEILDKYLKLREKWNNKQLKNVFIKPNGTAITRQYVWSIMKKHLKLANLDLKLSPHSFRHTFATDLLDNDADLRIVQELLGHSNVTTTQIYTHLSNNRITDLYEKFHPKSDNLNKGNHDKD